MASVISVPTMISRCVSGRIAYLGADGQSTGHERFELHEMPGGRLLRAWCVLTDAGLWREVSLAMDDAWRPRDGTCRLWHADGAMDLMTFAITADRVEVRQQGPHDGVQTIPTPTPLPYLGFHPLAGDALIVHQRGQDDPGTWRPVAAVTNSVSPHGEGAVATALAIDVAFVGSVPITVAAGSFAAWHYQLRWREDWLPADLWVRAGDGVFLRMDWAETGTGFELVALVETGEGL